MDRNKLKEERLPSNNRRGFSAACMYVLFCLVFLVGVRGQILTNPSIYWPNFTVMQSYCYKVFYYDSKMIQSYIKRLRNCEQHIRKIKSAMDHILHQWAFWKEF